MEDHWRIRVEEKIDRLLDELSEIKIRDAGAHERHPTRHEFEELERSHLAIRDDVKRGKWLFGVIVAAAVFAANLVKDLILKGGEPWK